MKSGDKVICPHDGMQKIQTIAFIERKRQGERARRVHFVEGGNLFPYNIRKVTGR